MFKWRIGKPDAEKVEYFLKKTDLNRLVLEILSARGIVS